MSESIKRPHLFIVEQLPKPLDREYKVSGGGGTYPRSSYQNHANLIYKEAADLKKEFAHLEEFNKVNKRYYRVELPDKQSAWSGNGKNVEDNIHATIVGSPEKNIAHVSTNAASFDLFLEQLSTYQDSENNKGKSKFASLENVGLIPVNEKITARLKRNLDSKKFNGEALVSFFPDLTNEERETYKIAIAEFLKNHSGSIVNSYNSETGLIMRIKANKKEDIELLGGKFFAVQSLDAVDQVIFPSSIPGKAIDKSIVIDTNSSLAKACIFDSGVVQSSRFLDGSIIAHENPLGVNADPDHGTFVASRIIYGDSLRDQVSAGTLTPDVKVLSVCVFPRDGLGNKIPVSTEQLMRIVRDTVERWHQEIRVYNLSLNLFSEDSTISSAITDDTINPLSAELDFLAKKYNILFVVTTGNYPAPKAPFPTQAFPEYFNSEDTRICPPAESMLSITVGSISGRENMGSMVKAGSPSPFTRRGPGFGSYRKPDITAHGGNYGLKWTTDDDLSVAGIRFDMESLAYGVGTSYAAPIITRLAAHLFSKFPNISAELVRAMLIHFSTYKNTQNLENDLLLNLIGNGCPDVEGLLHSNPWEQSFLYEGLIDYRKIVSIPFYIPEGLVKRSGKKVLRTKITVTFSPETDRNLKSGYCKSYLRTRLFKRNKNNEFVQVSSGSSLDTVTDAYSTIVRRDNHFSSEVSHGDWRLDIEQISRWSLRDPNTRYGVVISIIDPKRENDIDIAAMLKNEVPNRYVSRIDVREHIKI